MSGRLPFLLLASLLPLLPVEAGAEERRFSFRYHTEIGPVPAGQGPVHVFLPLPAETGRQAIESLEVVAPIPGAIESEPVYGNRFWHGRLAEGSGEAIAITVEAVVLRSGAGRPTPAALSATDRELFLGPNRRVVVGHELLDPILAEIRAGTREGGQAARARGIYDWVVDNVSYKKVGTGWGNGDTFWACNERYGNCTDFHALFISLARTEGIPARFEMGFPVPDDRPAGEVGGYHCWVEFYLPVRGWVPIDASEASKRPELRERFYGTQPADRIHFTTGRDLRLGPDHRDEPLNYFVYPHVEVGGRRWTGPVERSFAYSEVPDGAAAGIGVSRQAPGPKGESGG